MTAVISKNKNNRSQRKPQGKTKIVATIGPASWDDIVLKDMIRYGMNVARISASFADFNELKRVSTQIRAISPAVAIMLDTKGHKIRVTGFEKDILLVDGQHLLLQSVEEQTKTNSNIGINIRRSVQALKNDSIKKQIDRTREQSSKDVPIIGITYPEIENILTRNAKVLLDDGNITLQVVDIVYNRVECKVLSGGILKRRKTVNIPGVHLAFPTLSKKDEKDIKFAVAHDFDYIAASFIRDTKDVHAVRDAMGNTQIKLIAKIEEFNGVKNFDEILSEVDGIMVARGDLGVEMPLEKVPALQKEFISKSRIAGKPVIVATQMLESMRENKRPTRAEVSDVANAVIDGADALMLSAETSTGKYPAQAVKVMKKITTETEGELSSSPIFSEFSLNPSTEVIDALTYHMCQIVDDLNLAGVIVISRSGQSVASLARHRLTVPIWSLSTNPKLIAQHNLLYGVKGAYLSFLPVDRDQLVDVVVNRVYEMGELSPYDRVAVLSGSSIKNKSIDSILEIVNVQEVLKQGRLLS